jgi:hypothetical protein
MSPINLDIDNTVAIEEGPVPDNESKRQKKLNEYVIVDTFPEN